MDKLPNYEKIFKLLQLRLPEVTKKTKKIVNENNELKADMAFASIEYAKLDDERIILEKKIKNLLRENDLIIEDNEKLIEDNEKLIQEKDELIQKNKNFKQQQQSLTSRPPPPPSPPPSPPPLSLIPSRPPSSPPPLSLIPSTPKPSSLTSPPSTPRPPPPPPPSPPPSILPPVKFNLPLYITIECLDCDKNKIIILLGKKKYYWDAFDRSYQQENSLTLFKPKFKFDVNIKKWKIFLDNKLFAESDISEFNIIDNNNWKTTKGETFTLKITEIDKKTAGGKRRKRKTNKRKKINKKRKTYKR
jgi:hypothetical protein